MRQFEKQYTKWIIFRFFNFLLTSEGYFCYSKKNTDYVKNIGNRR